MSSGVCESRSKQAPREAEARPAVLDVRPAGRGDLVPLTFFFDTVLRNDYFIRRGQLEDILKGAYHDVYVAEVDSILVGVAITTRGSRLVNALVHPAYRGLGIGRELVRCSGATEVRAKIDMSTGDPPEFSRSRERFGPRSRYILQMDVSEPSPLVLSRRERQVVALIAHSLPLRAIADLLCLTFKTIESTRQSAYDKLGIHDRVAICRWAIRHGVDVSTPLHGDRSPRRPTQQLQPPNL